MEKAIEALRVGSFFFYKALWSILFGVAVTAAIDVFVDKERMAHLLGGRDVKTTALAAGLGAASSSCTFGSVAIGQSLFKKGASAESTFAFALASTNIVFELAILIAVLLGWAFFGAELIAGVLLVVIMYLLVRLTLPTRVFEEARRRLQQEEKGETPGPEGGASRSGILDQLGQRATWVRIASRYFATLKRIYKTVFLGFLISGFIIVLVPAGFWSAVFVKPTSFLGVLENTTLGVGAGIFSFIGSIGIVPFAAALWLGGVGFAAIVGCIVSDNITVPVLDVWRRYYGGKATVYIFAVFFVAMVASSVIIQYLFQVFGWIPQHLRVATLTSAGVRLDYTFFLTAGFIALSAFLWVIKRMGVPVKAERYRVEGQSARGVS